MTRQPVPATPNPTFTRRASFLDSRRHRGFGRSSRTSKRKRPRPGASDGRGYILLLTGLFFGLLLRSAAGCAPPMTIWAIP